LSLFLNDRGVHLTNAPHTVHTIVEFRTHRETPLVVNPIYGAKVP
jgi:hypothetical protein